MKKLVALVLRFLVIFVMAEISISLVWLTIVSMESGAGAIARSLYTVFIMSVPASIVSSAFACFFLLNRVYSSRFLGFITLFPLATAVMAGAAILHRFMGTGLVTRLPVLSATYAPVGEWFAMISTAPWPEYAAGLSSFTAFICGFWALTRITRNRPIFGAFLAPSGAMAALYLFTVYLSGPADVLFRLIGFVAPRSWYAIMLTSGTALVLLLADLLLAHKPAGGRQNA